MERMDNRAFVVVGPSGVGKGTVLKQVLAHAPECWLSVSATTRAPRPGEREGVDYFFVSDERFSELVETGQMLEWAWVHGVNRYGTPREPVDDAAARGRIPVLELDLAGARQVRRSMPEAMQIFIAPPAWEELERRLRARGTEGPEEIARRLETAREEMAAMEEFDIVVVNDSVSRATEELLRIFGISR